MQNENQQKDNKVMGITPGKWIIGKNIRPETSEDVQGIPINIGHYHESVTIWQNGNEDKQAEADAKAIVDSVNNTYGANINPESVPDMLEALNDLIEKCKWIPKETFTPEGAIDFNKCIVRAATIINKATIK